MSEEPAKKRSELWLLVPMFSGIFGGVVMYLLLKDDHERLARYCLYLGIAITAVWALGGASAVYWIYDGMDISDHARQVLFTSDEIISTLPADFGTSTGIPGGGFDGMCQDVSMPVCGEDGQTYGNACNATRNGVSVAREGAC